MSEHSPTITMALIGPGVLCVFGLAFLWAWVIERRRHYLLLLAAAPPLFGLGILVQAFYWPPATVPNALLSALFYTLAVLLAAEAILARSGQRLGLAADVAILAVILGGLWFFAVIRPNLLARVYIQNFGYGFILLAAALRLLPLMRGRPVDRVLFWVLLVFALHFFPRTLLTIGLSAPVGPRAFGGSLFWHALHLSLAVLGAALATAILAAALSDLIDDLRRERDVDGMTGVFNRRAFEQRATLLLVDERAAPCTLIACDLDHFKQINDRYGHGAGDEVLKAFARLLSQGCRAEDLGGRIGGEEFALLLPRTGQERACEVAERLRGALSRLSFPSMPRDAVVTASFGLAQARPGDTLSQLLARADAALYRAKRAGRDRIVLETAAPEAGRRDPAPSLSPS